MVWKTPDPNAPPPRPSTDTPRNRIISKFLQALYGGEDLALEPPMALAPYTAAAHAGTTLEQLHEWANEDSEVGRIFATQWRNAAEQGKERIILKGNEVITHGYEEYVTSKDGPIRVFDPNSPNGFKFLTQRRYDFASVRWQMEKLRPEVYGPVARPGSDGKRTSGVSEDFRESVMNDAIETQPDEPGPL